ERAEGWSWRGVRRVFAIFVKRGTVEEWLPDANAWHVLDPEGTISDPCLVRPFRVKGLFDRAAADDEVVWALEAKGNPVILAIKAAAEEQGAKSAARWAVLIVLEARGLEVTPRVRDAVMGAEDMDQLDEWLGRAVAAASADEVVEAMVVRGVEWVDGGSR